MNNKPLISIHMITYNHEKYVAQAIEGVIAQKTDYPMELVIGDDCSTDNTQAIIESYRLRYPDLIKPLYRDKNVGSNANYWHTFSRCNGKYVALCEGDDYWTHPLKLQMQVDFLESHAEYGLVYTDLDSYIQSEDRFAPMNLEIHEGDVYASLMLIRCGIWTVTVCLRKELLVGFPQLDAQYFRGDTFVWLELSRKALVKYLPEKTAVYRILKESLSHFTHPKKEAAFTLRVANLYHYYATHYPIPIQELNDHVLRQSALGRLRYAFWFNDWKVLQSTSLQLFPVGDKRELLYWCAYRVAKFRPFLCLISYVLNKKAGRA